DHRGWTVNPDTLGLVAAERMRLVERPVAVARDVKVEPAVTVIVEERRRRRPGSAFRPEVWGGAERAVALVEIEHIRPVVGQVEVGEAVVVDVADRHAVAEAPEADAGSLGDVLEPAVAGVAIQLVPLGGGR